MKKLGLLFATLLLSSFVHAQSCWQEPCPYQSGVGAKCGLVLNTSGACSCYEEGSAPNQSCGEAGDCNADGSGCSGGTGGGGGGSCGEHECPCGDGTCGGECCSDAVGQITRIPLDEQFYKVREDWQKAGDKPIRLYLKKSCASGEIGKRYRQIGQDLNTKLVIFTVDAQQFNAENWDRVQIPASQGQLSAKDEADMQRVREDWAKTEGPIRLYLTSKVADGEMGRRYKAIAKELRKPLTIFVVDEEDIRVTPEERRAITGPF